MRGMEISKIKNGGFDYDNLRDVNLSPSLAAQWTLTPLNGQGLCTITVGDYIAQLRDPDGGVYEHPYNRGIGGVYNSFTTQSILTGFNSRAFGLITVAIIANTNNDPDYPKVFLMLADAHNRSFGLLKADDAGLLSKADLAFPLIVQVIPANEFIEVYGLLNTNRSQTGAEKYLHPVLRYGNVIFKLGVKARVENIEKSLACQLAYLIEHYENDSIGSTTLYKDTFDARTRTKRKALHRASVDPVNLSPVREKKLVTSLQWMEAVKNQVDQNLGAKLLTSGPFCGMLMLWHLRGEDKLGKTAKGFAKKLDKKAMTLKPLMACITHSGDSTIESTEISIHKLL